MNFDQATPVSVPTNPFSTRFIRPSAVDYLFPPGMSAADVIQALDGCGWRGQIIGPHGSGKSTLLASLTAPLRQAGQEPVALTFHQGERWLPRGWTQRAQAAGARLIIVDGYEQLNAWSQLRLKLTCRRRSWGLLVTAHKTCGFRTLLRTQPSLDVAQAVVTKLLPTGDAIIGRQDVAQSYAACGGNVREMLFSLYDQYEQAGATSAAAT